MADCYFFKFWGYSPDVRNCTTSQTQKLNIVFNCKEILSRLYKGNYFSGSIQLYNFSVKRNLESWVFMDNFELNQGFEVLCVLKDSIYVWGSWSESLPLSTGKCLSVGLSFLKTCSRCIYNTIPVWDRESEN